MGKDLNKKSSPIENENFCGKISPDMGKKVFTQTVQSPTDMELELELELDRDSICKNLI